MKQFGLFLILCTFWSCDKTNDPKASEAPCKISSSTLSSTLKLQYTYDENSKISKVEYLIGSNPVSTVVIDLDRNMEGQLISSKWYYNGTLGSEETYEYSGEKIVKVRWENDAGSIGINKISYNENGLITKFTYGTLNSDFPYDTYEYDQNNVLIKTSSYGFVGELFSIKTVTPTTTHKSPESIALQAGIPYDLYYGRPYKTVLGGDGTRVETFERDANGEIKKLASQGDVYDSQLNENGYLTNYKIDVKLVANPYTNITSYALQDCGN